MMLLPGRVIRNQKSLLLILQILHDLDILLDHNSHNIKYLGSLRNFSIHRRTIGYVIRCQEVTTRARP